MKRIHLYSALIVATLALSGMAGAQTPAPSPSAPERGKAAELGKLDRHDQEFLRKAAGINLVEIELGRAAEKNSTDPKVKKFAASLVKDHSEANQKLARLAASKGYALPEKISSWDRHSLNQLEKEQGEQFNKSFLTFNIKGHEKALDLYEKAASHAQDPDIKAFAEKNLPRLKEHLALARNNTLEAVGEKQQKIQQHPQQQPAQQQKGL
jgi:putative membrane protein